MHSFRYLRCLFVLTQPIILGIDQPIIELTITLMTRNKYSGGIAGGSGLKLAVKVPYRLTVKFEVSLNGMLKLRFKFSTQPLNSKSLLG